jgi:tetratricopeptide (TPR) repeat protein
VSARVDFDARDGEAGVGLMELRRTSLSETIWLRALLCLCSVVLLLATPTVSAQVIGRGDLNAEETLFIRELLDTYNSPDLARLWIQSRMKSATSTSRATLEYMLADATRIEGDIDGYEAQIQALASRYPDHPRSKGAQLEAVLAALLRLHEANTEAIFATSPPARSRAIVARDRIWTAEVRHILEDNILLQNREVDALEAKVVAAPDAEQKKRLSAEFLAKVVIRDLWEFQLLNALKIYSKMLPDGNEEAQKLFAELATRAKEFVDQRYENFGRRYEAQLIHGQALASLGQPEQAANELELLVDIEPSVDPPYDVEVVFFIRRMRIESLAGSLAAYNRAGRPEEGLELLEYLYEEVDPNFPYRKTPEDPSLTGIVASLNIEESVSRIAAGDRATGLGMLMRLISEFDDPAAWKADPGATREVLDQLARGLSHLVDLKVGDLSPEVYARAATGYRDRGLLDQAIEAAKYALASHHEGEAPSKWRAKALYEIGESSDALGRPEEAAIAYQFLAENYPRSEMVAMASQNFFAIVGDLAAEKGGAWDQLVPVAEKLFSDNSRGLGSEQLKLAQATEEELDGNYPQARDLFRRISRTYTESGVERPVPFFFRARAGGARCLFRISTDVDQGIRDAAGELLPLLLEARNSRDVPGESVLRYELARMYWGDRKKSAAEAIEALSPVLGELAGDSVYREGAILLLVEVLCAEGQFAQAEIGLNEIRQYWPGGSSLVAATYYLIDGYRASSSDQHLRRAGELVLRWIRLPGAQFEEAGPRVKLGLASILIDGGFASEAASILAQAQTAARDLEDQFLDIGVSYFLAKAANAAGKHQDALDSLDSIVERYNDETFNGSYPDAPFVFVQRAAAHRGLYEVDRSSQHLDAMSEDLTAALAILDQRRRSLIFAGQVAPLFERDYWATWLQYMELMKAQSMCERVVQLIRSRRLMAGGEGSSFAPEALQVRFDQLEKDCQ